MCGIAGVLQRSGEPVAPELLKRMSDAIAHRGPDGEGQFADGPVGLAQSPPRDHRPESEPVDQPIADAGRDAA